MNLFWDEGRDSIRNFWSLTELMRCRDSWYNSFLQQCRHGCLSADFYCFLHGLPTFTASMQNCSCNDDVTEDAVLGQYKESWKKAFLGGASDMADVIAKSECATCRQERLRRHRVFTHSKNGISNSNLLSHSVQNKGADSPSQIVQTDLQSHSVQNKGTSKSTPNAKPDFTLALALYSFNVPRYFAILLRAREFAKAHEVQLSWCYAQDTPMHPDDRELKAEALEKKRVAWLQRHDQNTCNLISLFPLAVGLPVRLTDNEDRDRHLYRGRGGVIHCLLYTSPSPRDS